MSSPYVPERTESVQPQPPGIFDKLVRNLSASERRDFLHRLGPQDATVSSAIEAPPRKTVAGWQEVYQTYGLLRRLVLWFRRLFRGKDLGELVQDQMLLDLAADIQKLVPGMFSLHIRLAHGALYFELRKVLESLEFLKPLFKTAFGADKQDFIAFLVGLEWPEVQDRLVEETDFQKIYESNPERPLKDIKTIVETNFRLILEEVTPEKKKSLYSGLKALYALRNLMTLSEEKLLHPFLVVPIAGGPGNASLNELRDPLVDLCEKLYAFETPPPRDLLEGIFLFHHQDKVSDQEADLGPPIVQFLERTVDTWEVLRQFHLKVPLLKLSAWLSNSTAWQPRLPGGAEDWFQLYKRFWQARIDQEYELFARDRQARQILGEITHFLGMSVEEFRRDSYYPAAYRGVLPTRGDTTLSYLRHFIEKVFVPHMNPILQIILLEGDFYKRNNRGVFTDSYNEILQIPDQLSSFQRKFSSDGDWGRAMAEIRTIADENLVLARMKEVFLTAGEWVADYIKRLMPTVEIFGEVLRGIVKTRVGGKYDTLSNLNSLGGKANGVFKKDVESLLNKWESFIHIFKELSKTD